MNDGMLTLTFEFYGYKAKEAREAFIAWYLDGGGDGDFDATCDDLGIEVTDQDWDLKSNNQIIRLFTEEGR